MGQKVFESIRIFQEDFLALDRLKSEMRLRGIKPSYAELFSKALSGAIAAEAQQTPPAPAAAPQSIDPNHALLDAALSASTPEQQRALIASLRSLAGIPIEVPNGNEKITTERVTGSSAGRSRARKAG